MTLWNSLFPAAYSKWGLRVLRNGARRGLQPKNMHTGCFAVKCVFIYLFFYRTDIIILFFNEIRFIIGTGLLLCQITPVAICYNDLKAKLFGLFNNGGHSALNTVSCDFYFRCNIEIFRKVYKESQSWSVQFYYGLVFLQHIVFLK